MTAQPRCRTQEALATIASAKRGCPWLYPIADASGDMAIVESGPYTDTAGKDFDPLQYVSNKAVLADLPSREFIAEHSSADIFM